MHRSTGIRRQLAQAVIAIPRYKMANTVTPKGTNRYYFDFNGEYSTRSSDIKDWIFTCIAINQNNAKDKYHKWAKENLKTSAQWFKEIPAGIGLEMIDSKGGWDQKDFAYDFEKKLVTKQQFIFKLVSSNSTIANKEMFDQYLKDGQTKKS